MVDRIRERAGREAEQDIELTGKEIVQEYLRNVKIVDRRIGEGSKTCNATAVIPKSQTQPKPAPDRLKPVPTVIRQTIWFVLFIWFVSFNQKTRQTE